MNLKKLKCHYMLIITIMVCALTGSALHSQEMNKSVLKNKTDPPAYQKKTVLDTEAIVRYIVERNIDVKKALLDYKTADSDLNKFNSQYDTYLYGKASYSRMETSPENPAYLFQGTDMTHEKYEAGISRRFSTGTEIHAGVNSMYQNIRGSEMDMGHGATMDLMGGKGYQSGLFISLKQELLKNSFGKTDRIKERIIENSVEMKKRAVKFYLSRLLTEALTGYWHVAVAEESVTTAEMHMKSTDEIRSLYRRKTVYGLANEEDALDWETKYLQSSNMNETARKNLYEAKLSLLGTLDLPRDTPFTLGKTFDTNPPDVTLEQALKDALEKREDLLIQKKIVTNCELEMKMADNLMLPTLKLNMSAGNTDYSRDNYSGSWGDVNKQWSVGMEATYPLGNTDAVTEKRSSMAKYEKEMLNLKKMEIQIRDDLDTMIKNCDVQYRIYNQNRRSTVLARSYYNKILAKFKMGKTDTVRLKLSLDNYIFMRQTELNSLVNYNIALIRRDFARNTVFENYGIDIDGVLKKYAGKRG